VFAECCLDFGKLGIAPDETGGCTPQVSPACVQRPQRWKLGPECGCSDLKHPDRRRHIPQPSRPQIHEIHSAQQTRRRLGRQDLTTMPGGHHPCGTIEHRAEVVPISQLRFTGCQPHSYRQLQGPLRGYGGIHRRSG
jgi:hypothetical protein